MRESHERKLLKKCEGVLMGGNWGTERPKKKKKKESQCERTANERTANAREPRENAFLTFH